jgi:adenylate cyclase
MDASKATETIGLWTLARSLLRRWQPARAASDTASEQLRRLQYFLSPQVWKLILTSSEEDLLAFRQREIAVVFCDLRGFTAFARTAPSAVIVDVLGAYHRCIGPVIIDHDGILERFTGDGLMVYFDDAPLEEQARRAVRMAVRIRDLVGELSAGWHLSGHHLEIGIGIALGSATLGPIGFGQRRDYAAVGPVTNLASRLCAEAAGGQVLVPEHLHAAVRDIVEAERLGPRRLKGFEGPVELYNVRRVTEVAGAARDARPSLECAKAKG